MLDVSLKPVEELVFRSPLTVLAEYHCRPEDPLFANSGPSNAHSVVFPLTTTRIRRRGTTVVEDPTTIALYDAGEEYWSEPVSDEGSHCAWFTLDAGILEEIAADGRRRAQLFPMMQVPARPGVAIRQRRLFQMARETPSDTLAVEEEACSIATEILRFAERVRPAKAPARVVSRALEYVAASFLEPMSLAEVAAEVGVSPAYLSNAFRSGAGRTMHSFREELRLRRSLDLLPDCRGDFTRVALDLGYSSHSHFTSRFRRMFGMTPSEYVHSFCRPPRSVRPRLLCAL